MKVWEQEVIREMANNRIFFQMKKDEQIWITHDNAEFSDRGEAIKHELKLLMEDVEEHAKSNKIGESDYEKLKAAHVLFGDCWVTKNADSECMIYSQKPILKHESRIGLDFDYWCIANEKLDSGYALTEPLYCLSTEESLYLTEQWLKEVEHE